MLTILRKPRTLWWHVADGEALGDTVDVTPFCYRPFTEVCAYVWANDRVEKFYFLDSAPEVHATAFGAPDSARGVDHPKVGPIRINPGSVKVDLPYELARYEVVNNFWLAKAATEKNTKPVSFRQFGLSQETDIVACVKSYKSIPWCFERITTAYAWQRDTWRKAGQIILAFTRGGSHSRVFWLPGIEYIDMPAPRGAIDTRTIVAGSPAKLAKKRWFKPSPTVRLELLQ